MADELTKQDLKIVSAMEEQWRSEAQYIGRLRTAVLATLQGGVWHTTSPERFSGILNSGSIFPEPEIPDSERWMTRAGPKHYPYVRTLGGVSLFEFDHFDPEAYREEFPVSTWAEFVPYRSCWKGAVWIEIDPHQIADGFISGAELLRRWKNDSAHGHNIMPMIEAACLGPIPVSTFKRALQVAEQSDEIELIEL